MAWSDPWDTLWGGPAAVPTLRDTLYYGVDTGGGIADLATDQSQYLDNQSTGATWHWEPSAGASRFNLTGTWTAEFEIETDNTDTGRLFGFGSGGTGIGIRVGNVAGQVDIIVAGATRGALALPGVSGSNQRFLVAWAAMPNPDTTGAADAVRHELSAWNLDTGAFDTTVILSVDRGSGTTDFIFWASSSAGANTFTGIPHACRFSAAYHTPTESFEEMVGQQNTPTLLGEERLATDVPPRSSTVGDDGHFAGPVHLLGAVAARENDLRLVGPLVNVRCASTPLLEGDLGAQNLAWLYEDPEDPDMQLYLEYCYRSPIPRGCKYAWVRLFIQAPGPTDLDVACYSMSQPGIYSKPDQSPTALRKFRVTSTLVAPTHGAGGTAGEWVDLGLLRIAKDLEECSYFILGFRGSNVGTTWRVKSVCIDPVLVDQANGP